MNLNPGDLAIFMTWKPFVVKIIDGPHQSVYKTDKEYYYNCQRLDSYVQYSPYYEFLIPIPSILNNQYKKYQ